MRGICPPQFGLWQPKNRQDASSGPNSVANRRRHFQPRLEILESRELLSAAPLLHVSPDGRHLLDSANQPVYLVGDTAWSLAVSLSETDAISYLQQRGAQGFNAVLVDSVALRSIISGSSLDQNGNAPFNGFLPGT